MSYYSDQLKDPRWQRKRLEIFQRDKFQCRSCCATEFTLHVHHWEYADKPWEGNDDFKWTVCEFCHARLHMQEQCSKLIDEFWESIPEEAEPFQIKCIVRSKTGDLKHLKEFEAKHFPPTSAVRLSPGSPEDSCDTNNTAKRTQGLQGDSCFIAATPEDDTGSTVSPKTGNPVPA